MMLGGVVALLCFGGAGVAFVAYRQATEPDRSAPDVAVSNYLRALFVERNDVQAELYTCGNKEALGPIEDFLADVKAREQQHSISIVVSWGSLTVEGSGERATVTTDVSRTISDGSESDHQTWRFGLIDEDGWRVCSAAKV
jgi:hypothetical protein